MGLHRRVFTLGRRETMNKSHEIELRDGVSVSVKFLRYEHAKEYGSILIATWSGAYSECPSSELDGEPFYDYYSAKCTNTRYIDGIMRASLSIFEPCGVIVDVSQLVCYQEKFDEILFYGINNPVTGTPLPLAFVVSSPMLVAMAEEVKEAELFDFGYKLCFVNFHEALDEVIPKTKRYGL